MAKLSLKHIYKIYDNGTKAVDDFNLEIGDNEFIVFVGPSGCGKSTTLRMIAGLEDITAGDFLIDGALANQLEPKHRDMAMVFQNYALYPHMTVYDNMAFGLKIRHIPKDEIERRVQEAAKILDITDQLNKKPKEMSGGQKQRVALGRAIVRKPKVFLLDEPLSNLDAKLRSSMRTEITRLHNVLKTTFIYVTHDQVEAMTMGTRIVVMRRGVMQQVDTPMNLYDYPNNIFVAGFIGTPQMNFIDSKISFDNKNSIVLEFGNNKISLERSYLARLDNLVALKESEVVIGIRPEHISLAKENDKNAIEVVINQVEALGNEANLIVSTLDQSQKFTIRIFRDDSLKSGDKIYVFFNVEKLKLFDKESTNTLLPRLPKNFSYKGKISGNSILLLGSKIKLPAFIKDKLDDTKDVVVTIPFDAIVEGEEISLNTISIEKTGDVNAYIGEIDGSYMVLPEMSGFSKKTMKFSIDLSKCSFISEDLEEVKLPAIKFANFIRGKLIPFTRNIYEMNKTLVTKEDVFAKVRLARLENPKFNAKMSKIKEDDIKNVSFKLDGKKYSIKNKKMKIFNYSVLGKQLVPEESSIIKIYSLLGKKFDLHDIDYTLSCDKIRVVKESLIEGIVIDIIDYEANKYAKVMCGDIEIIVKIDQELKIGDKIHIDFDACDLGISDVNFGVKLI